MVEGDGCLLLAIWCLLVVHCWFLVFLFCVSCISLLHISVAYFCRVAVLHIYIAYLCCCVVVFCRLSLGVDVWSFGGCLESIFGRFGGSEGCLERSFGGLEGSWTALGRSWVALGPLLACLGWLLARLGALLARLGPLLAALGAV